MGSISISRFHLIQASIRSVVNTPPRVRNSWSSPSALTASSSEPGGLRVAKWAAATARPVEARGPLRRRSRAGLRARRPGPLRRPQPAAREPRDRAAESARSRRPGRVDVAGRPDEAAIEHLLGRHEGDVAAELSLAGNPAHARLVHVLHQPGVGQPGHVRPGPARDIVRTEALDRVARFTSCIAGSQFPSGTGVCRQKSVRPRLSWRAGCAFAAV